MQLDPAVAGCSIPPDPREQHETPEPARAAPAPSGPQKSCPETLKNSLFFFRGSALSPFPEPELIWRPCAGEGADLMRLGELEVRAAALCLPTASLQRWKCETLIDHFKRSLLCGADRSCGPARSQNAV